MPKRQINKKGGGKIRGVDPLKKSERQFGAALDSMIDLMGRIFRNQVLYELNQSTIKKFADAKPEDSNYLKSLGFNDEQIGNYANVFLQLSKRVQRKLLKRFDDKRLEKIARMHLNEVNRRNAKQFYGRVEDAIGINSKELYNTEGLTFQINAMELETAQWAKKLRDETLEMFTANSLRVMAEGGDLTDVLETFKGMEEKRRNHAKMVARTQISTFNSLLTKARAENLGITKAVWQTSADERVRRCHQLRDNKEFDLKKGLYSSCDGKWLLPGADYNCRCVYQLVLPDEDE